MQQVVVQLFNGLGNQLFQYAAGRWLASGIGASLKLVHNTPPDGDAGRPVLLEQFAIRNPVRPMTALDRLVVTSRSRLSLMSRLARALGRIQLMSQSPDQISAPFGFEPDAGARSIYMSGYFQEYGLVSDVASVLRRELTLDVALSARSQDYAASIRSARRPISVHLRRGDYLTTFGPNGVLPISYYERAIAQMQRQFRDATFYVFSDDLAFAKFWARSYPRMTVVDCNDSALAHECLHLMSLCRHHIIANSTFSWWGAWLNARRDKQVIAPDHWLGSATAKLPVACPDWRLLPADRPLDLPPEERIARRA